MDRSHALWMLRQLRPQRLRLAVSITFAIFSAALPTLDPLMLRRLIDSELPQHRFFNSLLLICGIAVCFAGTACCLCMSMYLNYQAQQQMAHELRMSMLNQLSCFSAAFHEQTLVGNTLIRLENDVEQATELGSTAFAALSRAAILLTANTLIMFYLNTAVPLALLPTLGLFFVIRAHFHRRLEHQASAAQTESGRATGLIYEWISSLPQIQLLCAEKIICGRAANAWAAVRSARVRRQKTELSYTVAVHAALALSGLLVLTTGALQVTRGALTIGGLVAVYAYSMRTFEPVGSILETLSKLSRMSASIVRIRALLEITPRVADHGWLPAPGSLVRGIEFRDVSFSYDGGAGTLHRVSFEISPGDRVGMIGASGSGKSTIARLMARQWDPQSGQIYLEGTPLQEYSLSALRQTICYVPQNPVLFSGSLRENLVLGNESCTPRDIEEVVATVRLEEVLRQLPRGLDTNLGAGMQGLSGGERQRVALARAILRRPAVLVMDESTSALDALTEAALLRDMEKLCPQTTLVVISHRLEAIPWLRRSLVVERGKVVPTIKAEEERRPRG
jgi:ABC-type bacteriocin/lantibiotic exporter with double-glycine peptidase domain